MLPQHANPVVAARRLVVLSGPCSAQRPSGRVGAVDEGRLLARNTPPRPGCRCYYTRPVVRSRTLGAPDIRSRSRPGAIAHNPTRSLPGYPDHVRSLRPKSGRIPLRTNCQHRCLQNPSLRDPPCPPARHRPLQSLRRPPAQRFHTPSSGLTKRPPMPSRRYALPERITPLACTEPAKPAEPTA